jgi:outer membrane protein OmpA-like peptidoglycan-associated protein/tetratricopeptide (TPR) repeat protein
MKKTIQLVAIIALAAACSPGGRLLNEADRHYDNLEYHTAAGKYREYIRTNRDPKAEARLAECYLRMNRVSDAEEIYARVAGYPDATPESKLHYARVLKKQGKYREAGKWYVEYLLDQPDNAVVTAELRSCDSLASYTRYSYEYIIGEVSFTDEFSDFSPVYYKDGIVFCSDRSKPEKPEQVSAWTGRSYFDLYYTEYAESTIEPATSAKSGPMGETGVIKKAGYLPPALFAPELNSNYNEGPACFSKDGNTIYFTRNLVDKKQAAVAGEKDINHLQIYRSVLGEIGWSAPELLSFNNKQVSVGHPALSKDEKRIYFISDKEGGFGGTDIYYSDYQDGKWSEPVNAGEIVNTAANEMFPVINVDNKGNERLYFSTDGGYGMGGLDIYAADISCNVLSKPVHLRAPINSPADDFGLVLKPDGLTGMMSTNRGSANGVDKLVTVKKYIPEFFVEVTVYKKGTRTPLSNAMIDLTDLVHKGKTALATDPSGKIITRMQSNSELLVKVKKDNYYAASGYIDNIGRVFSDTLRLALELDPIIINKPVRLDNIYYDYDKWAIREDARPSLDKLVQLLKENPGIHIELSSHTDSRGKDAYNQKLSQKRAQSAVDYIISQQISPERIYAKGYGESKLLNKCKNGVKCTEDEHQLNRRTEFKVVKVVTELAPAQR